MLGQTLRRAAHSMLFEVAMAQLKGSKTEENLKTAFAGESQAHTKYLYFASKARKDGYEQIAASFFSFGVIDSEMTGFGTYIDAME